MQRLDTPAQAASWLRARTGGNLSADSRQLGAGDGFIAWPGAKVDARRFVKAALAQGAGACLVENEGLAAFDLDDARVAAYAGLKQDCGPIAAAYYEIPSDQLDVLAVTGTNGKTSTTWWLAQALSGLSQPIPCGLIGTLGVGQIGASGQLGAGLADTGLTTPDPVLLQATLHRFVAQGLSACAMEASSIGLAEHRLDGTRIRTAVLTNFTQDHLDYHVSMQAYWQAKQALFDWPGLRAVVLNIDDEKGAELAQQLRQRPLDLWTVSCKGKARLQAKNIHLGARGLSFSVCEADECHPLSLRLAGEYNITNLLEVIASMRTLGVSLADAVQSCHHLGPVPGRMELVEGDASTHNHLTLPMVVIDYAHTPDALAQVLQALQPQASERGGQLWCVFGCGGDRDASKRPLMGAIAARYAHRVVLTSDNPRSEKPEVIISQILLGLEGCSQVEVEPDRAQAIAQTLAQADANDLVLVAGKGHEAYQEVAGQRLPFSDHLEARKALLAWPSNHQAGGRG